MIIRRTFPFFLSLATLAGCYHATIETGAPPSPQTLERPWADGWFYGLVSPSTTETASRCPNGVSRIETKLSFANQLVGMITSGIYSPMNIKVTCAAAPRGAFLYRDSIPAAERKKAAADWEDVARALRKR